jgi:hypothetical protein
MFPSLTVHFGLICHREVRILQLFENIVPKTQEVITMAKVHDEERRNSHSYRMLLWCANKGPFMRGEW